MNKNIVLYRSIKEIAFYEKKDFYSVKKKRNSKYKLAIPEVLFITSFPPRECGIATYSQDLLLALKSKFNQSFGFKFCALENESNQYNYNPKSDYTLDTSLLDSYEKLADRINKNNSIEIVLLQHEFGFFQGKEHYLKILLQTIEKPKVTSFHTVLPNPNKILKLHIQEICYFSASVIVMTETSAKILMDDYGIEKEKIMVIPHGVHLVPHSDKNKLKEKYQLKGKKILSTFGLLSAGKSIETTLEALPKIIEANPNILFLIIGKTHPTVFKNEGEKNRKMLQAKIKQLQIENHVRFINQYLPLNELLDYLQLTDIYLFTSKDPNQAVSGTFSYAISCGCPIISTPIPHAKEVLKNDAGILIDFENSLQLSVAVNKLLKSHKLKKKIIKNGLHRIVPAAWENSAIQHAKLFQKTISNKIELKYNLPEINLSHIQKMTTSFGIIQFAKINKPDLDSGYTLDDNARAMVALCQHYQLTKDAQDLILISLYLRFIKYCLQSNGKFLNYVNKQKEFTEQNKIVNLEDSNGRAVWALGYLLSIKNMLPIAIVEEAETLLQKVLPHLHTIYSTRAMAFAIKGLYYQNKKENLDLIKILADRLTQMYQHERKNDWLWYENYLTYGNSILPEAMLCAYLSLNEPSYKKIAKESFDFLLSKIFIEEKIKVISNKGWLLKGISQDIQIGGEQPIDIAYTILALEKFYTVFRDQKYKQKASIAFNWFLGENHLKQTIYNPCTGGCYDGLEEYNVNLNQGAESTISYLMARLLMENGF